MLFGRRRFSSPILFAPVEDAPEIGGGGLPPPPPPPKTTPPPPKINPSGEPPTEFDPSKDPRVLAMMQKAMKETADRTSKETEERVKREHQEAAENAQKTAEERARQEATTAKAAATKAQNEAAKFAAEAKFVRAINRAGLVPHNDMCESMAWAAAQQKLAETGKTELDAADIAAIKAEHHYLFASASGAGGPSGTAVTSGAVTPGTNPAAVMAAGTLSTQPAPSAAGAGAATGQKKNARDMTREEFAAFLAARGVVVASG